MVTHLVYVPSLGSFIVTLEYIYRHKVALETISRHKAA